MRGTPLPLEGGRICAMYSVLCTRCAMNPLKMVHVFRWMSPDEVPYLSAPIDVVAGLWAIVVPTQFTDLDAVTEAYVEVPKHIEGL